MTPEKHYQLAEELLAEAQAVYEELKAVPVEGVKFSYEINKASHYISKSQDTVRDGLGKKIAGLHAAALVHASLAACCGMDDYYTFPPLPNLTEDQA